MFAIWAESQAGDCASMGGKTVLYLPGLNLPPRDHPITAGSSQPFAIRAEDHIPQEDFFIAGLPARGRPDPQWNPRGGFPQAEAVAHFCGREKAAIGAEGKPEDGGLSPQSAR